MTYSDRYDTEYVCPNCEEHAIEGHNGQLVRMVMELNERTAELSSSYRYECRQCKFSFAVWEDAENE